MKSLASIQKGKEMELCAMASIPGWGNHFCKGAGTQVRDYWRVTPHLLVSYPSSKPLGSTLWNVDTFLMSPDVPDVVGQTAHTLFWHFPMDFTAWNLHKVSEGSEFLDASEKALALCNVLYVL